MCIEPWSLHSTHWIVSSFRRLDTARKWIGGRWVRFPTLFIHTLLRVLTIVGSIYARAGIVCFELLTGWPPFYDRDFSKMCEKILYKPLSFPSTKVTYECLHLPQLCMYVCIWSILCLLSTYLIRVMWDSITFQRTLKTSFEIYCKGIQVQ